MKGEPVRVTEYFVCVIDDYRCQTKEITVLNARVWVLGAAIGSTSNIVESELMSRNQPECVIMCTRCFHKPRVLEHP